MNMPVSCAISDLLEKYGVCPLKYPDLVTALMHYVYDQRDDAVDLTYGKMPGKEKAT